MINQGNVVEVFEESIVDDDVIVVKDDDVTFVEEYDNNMLDYEWIECMDCVQRKMICIITILIVGTILLVFAYTLNNEI